MAFKLKKPLKRSPNAEHPSTLNSAGEGDSGNPGYPSAVHAGISLSGLPFWHVGTVGRSTAGSLAELGLLSERRMLPEASTEGLVVSSALNC